MSKSAFEKWEDLENDFSKNNKEKVSEFYISSQCKTRVYFQINDISEHVLIEFPKNLLKNALLPVVKGLRINVSDCEYISKDHDYITIKNEETNKDIFHSFSSSLCDMLVGAKSYLEIYQSIEETIKYYKDFFSNPNLELSLAEEQGLCAELIELSQLIDKKGENIVNNWLGPNKNKRDFVFDDFSIEVKSTQSQTNKSITISNENQLNNNYPEGMKRLLLKVYVFEKNPLGLNVESCIENVVRKITNIELQDAFIKNLLKCKVIYKQYKSKHSFKIQEEHLYEVRDDFPKIIASNISTEIYDVKYKLNIKNLGQYEIEN